MHKLGKAVKTSAEGKDNVSAAVAAVLEDVEEYLVSNLVELERAGANGSNLKPLFLSSCAARLHFWALQIHSWLFVLYNVPDLLHCRTILVCCVLQGTRAVQCPLGKAANWPAACFSPPTCPSISNHKQFFGILRILCLHCIVYLQLAAVSALFSPCTLDPAVVYFIQPCSLLPWWTCTASMQCAVAGAVKDSLTKPDWAHVFLTVTQPLPLHQPEQEGQTASALRAACAGLMSKHSSRLRRAGVVQWEVCLRMPQGLPAWRVVVSSPTGAVKLTKPL